MVCVFFGHRDCYGLEKDRLQQAIENLIQQGVEEFLVGNQGQFDAMVCGCLRTLKESYPQIQHHVVLAYLPGEKRTQPTLENTIFPEGLETVHPKFAIDRRNQWMLAQADHCLCYINHSWGGAYKFAKLAKQKGKHILNIGTIPL